MWSWEVMGPVDPIWAFTRARVNVDNESTPPMTSQDILTFRLTSPVARKSGRHAGRVPGGNGRNEPPSTRHTVLRNDNAARRPE